MILSSEDKQFSLGEDGRIHWQKDASNPLTGPHIGHIAKGDDILQPVVVLDSENEILKGEDQASVDSYVQAWLERHLKAVLAPLFTLADDTEIEGPAKDIAGKVYEALGIIPREDIQDLINAMDETGRAALRKRRLRMGPLLVYLPELNKPASVRMQALVWSLWHGMDLPAIVPKDGIVSFSVKDQEVDAYYYRAIGYPVYGPRSIRVDMLDRVVCAVYDSANDGKFQAQHQMAEWLGSNIADLYDVLEAMGHKKIYDPLEEQIKEEAKSDSSVEPATEKETEAKPVEKKPTEEKPAEEKKEEKPVLATFRLKRGKASEKEQPRATKKPNKDSSKNKKKSHKKSHKPKQDRPKSITAAAPKSNPEDSPFAVLQQLKLGNDKD